MNEGGGPLIASIENNYLRQLPSRTVQIPSFVTVAEVLADMIAKH